jgi:hypothetical protein
VLLQCPVIVIHEMAMNSAIGMNVRGLVTVRARRVVGVAAGIAVVIRSGTVRSRI